ncbi:MAG: methylthioribulose 1-phosphate dehydratase [Myxococcales bacterium]|nr:methylthioribulose 1-phosphate dehydratase [Myxococcales bacterium]MDD9967722.1 methylthioribulose 1-phosphate dehydratase [Myxococcales bacterium]
MAHLRTRELIVELARQFYRLGWVTGTGGGIAIRSDDRIVLAPSGVQKEHMRPDDMFELDLEGEVLVRPSRAELRPSECAPLFLHAFRKRDAGAVIHSHGMFAMLASLTPGPEFVCSQLEMIKGIAGHGYHDRVRVPIIDNTAHECDLADALGEAIDGYSETQAVLVRRHGVYIWGRDWVHAKTQAECYHYLFEAVVRMRALGLEPEAARPVGQSEHGGKA